MILGAGASWDYGFPTGEQLLEEIVDVFESASSDQLLPSDPNYDIARGLLIYTTNLRKTDATSAPDFLFAKRHLGTFRSLIIGQLPISIDWFLQQTFAEDFQKEHFRDLGKIAISYSIGRYEEQNIHLQPWRRDLSTSGSSRKTQTPGWYRRFWQSLRVREISDFEELVDSQRLQVITFNYDRSFEKFILERLTSLYAAKNTYPVESAVNDAKKLLDQWNIQHVYGSLGGVDSFGKVNLQPSNPLQDIEAAARKIEIIRENSTDPSKTKEEIQKLVQEASTIIFLGFGFDETNCKLLSPQPLEKGHDRVFATTFGLGTGDRNRVIHRLLRTSDVNHADRKIKDEHASWDIDQYLRNFSPFESVACRD